MTPEQEALATVLAMLDRIGVPYMVTGSVAASYHGRPRATHDSDVVIDPTAAQLEVLVRELLAAEFYVHAERALAALQARRPFNVIDTRHACKIDLIIRRDRPFSLEEFGRRVSGDLALGRLVTIVSAEDSVLSKLEWARAAGNSERQLADAAGIVAVNPGLDRGYIERWAMELGVLDLWRLLVNDERGVIS